MTPSPAETELPNRWIKPAQQLMIRDLGLLLLRLGIGAMLLTHGWPKFTGFAEKAAKFADPLGIGHAPSLAMAVFAEVVCAGLVMLGLATRLAAVVVASTFVVITMIVHGADPFGDKELAFAYLLVYAVIVLTGPGRFSVDAMLKRSLGKKTSETAADSD